jgi:hypothetical protein
MYSNDLWSFNIITRLWKLLHRPTTEKSYPTAREQYSATKLANGKIIYIGGRTSATRLALDRRKHYLGDVWELDPGQIRSHKFLASSTGSIPASISDGEMMYHTMKASAHTSAGYRQSELCVKRMMVELLFEHDCIEEVKRISLFGPKRAYQSDGSSTSTFQEITVRNIFRS